MSNFKNFKILTALLLTITPNLAQMEMNEPYRTWNRDMSVAQSISDLGSTLRCLRSVYDGDVNDRIHEVWQGNMNLVQQQTIFQLTDDQFMSLIDEMAVKALQKLRSIHPQCISATYNCINENMSAFMPQDVEDLRNNLENMAATMKCILARGKPDARMHKIFAKAFVRYHGSRDKSVTSLAVTESETAFILAQLNELDARCQMLTVEDPCSGSANFVYGY